MFVCSFVRLFVCSLFFFSFITDDLKRCFNLQGKDAIRMRAKRMEQDGTIEKVGEYMDEGVKKYKYIKKSVLVL